MKDIPSVVRQLEDVLSRYYLVEIQLPEPDRDGASLQLDLIDAAGRKRKDLTLGFPHRPPACASAERSAVAR